MNRDHNIEGKHHDSAVQIAALLKLRNMYLNQDGMHKCPLCDACSCGTYGTGHNKVICPWIRFTDSICVNEDNKFNGTNVVDMRYSPERYEAEIKERVAQIEDWLLKLGYRGLIKRNYLMWLAPLVAAAAFVLINL